MMISSRTRGYIDSIQPTDLEHENLIPTFS